MHMCGDIDNIIGKGEEMRLKRVHSAIIATVLTCSMAATPVFAAPDTLKSLQDKQEDLQNQKDAAEDELNSLQSQLDTIMQKTADLEDQLIAKGEEIIQAKEDLKAAEEKRDEQYEAMKLRIKYMYEAGTGTATMEKVMTSGDISSILTQAEYSQQVHEYDRNQLKEYANTVQEIEDLQDKLETEMTNLQDLEAEYQQQQEDLNATISTKQDQVSDLNSMIQEAARKVQEEKDRQEAASVSWKSSNSRLPSPKIIAAVRQTLAAVLITAVVAAITVRQLASRVTARQQVMRLLTVPAVRSDAGMSGVQSDRIHLTVPDL